MIEFFLSLISRLRYYLFDLNLTLVNHFGESWFRFRRGLSSSELDELYDSMHDSLTKGIPLEEMMYNVASSKLAANKRKRAESFYNIASVIRDPLTECPISDALKPYIPRSQYRMMSRSEIDSSLIQALPYIQRLSIVDSKLRSRAFKSRFMALYYYVFPFLLYPFIDWIIKIQYMGDKPYGSDKFDPQYIFWHGVTVASTYCLVIFFIFYFSYLIFYFSYRDNPQTLFRRRVSYLPYFKSYSQFQVTSALISIAVSIGISEGRSIPRTIRSLIPSSTMYIKDFLEEMAISVESSSLREAVNSMQMLPNDVKDKLSMSLSNSGKSSKIAETAISSIEYVLNRNGSVYFIYTLFSTVFQLAAISIPLSVGSIVTASNSF